MEQAGEAEDRHVPRLLAVEARLLADDVLLDVQPGQEGEVRDVRSVGGVVALRGAEERVGQRGVLRGRHRLEDQPQHGLAVRLDVGQRDGPLGARREPVAQGRIHARPLGGEAGGDGGIEVGGEVVLDPDLPHAALAQRGDHGRVEGDAGAQQVVARQAGVADDGAEHGTRLNILEAAEEHGDEVLGRAATAARPSKDRICPRRRPSRTGRGA